MTANLYDQEEFLKKIGLTSAELAEWEKNGLLKSEGRIDSNIPFYTEEHVHQAQQIAHFIQMGYSLPEIRKIVKKIGLPKKESDNYEPKRAEYLTVGELAEQAKVNNRTIKYWEERGIIAPDRRTAGGFRLYSKHYVQLCRLILDLQNFGYTLDQIKEQADLFRLFIDLQADRERKQDAGAALAGLETMELRVQELLSRMKVLREGIERWDDLLKKKRKEMVQLKVEYARAGGNP
jgi:MerR family transcriptional regulator, repressor of the yfmOP operon